MAFLRARRLPGYLLAVLLVLGAGAGRAAADDLAGHYQAQGATAGGKAYQGTVQIEQLGALHVVLWKLADGEAYKGVGIRQGDVLGAAYGPGNAKFGIVVYRIQGGTLTGAWADSRDLKSELGHETLQGSPDLAGTYKITLGENRDGLTNYSGEVMIRKSGETYLVVWPTKPPAIGIGVRIGDTLVVAYSTDPKKLPGVVAYQATDADTLSGIWAIAATKQTAAGEWNVTPPQKPGREVLKRAP